MEASEMAAQPAQRRTFTPWIIYLTLMAVILFLYVRGWLFLRGYAGNIAAGLVQVSIPRHKLYLPIILSIVLIIAALLFRSRVAKFVGAIPPGLRGLLLPLPFYFIFTFNWRITLLLLLIGVLAWIFYLSLARFFRLMMGPLPEGVQVPLMRYWPAVLYTYLLTYRALPTVVVAVGLVTIQLFDAWMESYFAPVWAYQQTLAPPVSKVVYLTRLAVGITAPFVFAYSWGLFNPWMDRYTSLFGACIFLVTYFVMRGPRVAVRILILIGLFGLGLTEFGWADNCSGGVDCYNTVGFNSGALAALFGGLGAIGLIGLSWVLEAIDLKRIDEMTWGERVALSLFLDQIPIISNVKNFIEAMTWKDLITGAELSEAEWKWAVIGSILPLVLMGKAGKVAKAADKLGDPARVLDKASDLARGADDVGPFPWIKKANLGGGMENCSWVAREVDEALGVQLRGGTPRPYAAAWYKPLSNAEKVAEEWLRTKAAYKAGYYDNPSRDLGDLWAKTLQPNDLAGLRAFEQEYGSFFQPLTPNKITDQLIASGDGARGIVYVKDGEIAHVFNAVNWKGQVYFLDGQSGAVWTRIQDIMTYTGYDVWDEFMFLPTSG
jgi:hypothetical protein